jgi:hypothetical protein
VLQEVLDRLVQRVQQARQVRRVRQVLLDPQALRAIREQQVRQDLLVLQAQSERLDQLVQRVPQDHKAR